MISGIRGSLIWDRSRMIWGRLWRKGMGRGWRRSCFRGWGVLWIEVNEYGVCHFITVTCMGAIGTINNSQYIAPSDLDLPACYATTPGRSITSRTRPQSPSTTPPNCQSSTCQPSTCPRTAIPKTPINTTPNPSLLDSSTP